VPWEEEIKHILDLGDSHIPASSSPLNT